MTKNTAVNGSKVVFYKEEFVGGGDSSDSLAVWPPSWELELIWFETLNQKLFLWSRTLRVVVETRTQTRGKSNGPEMEPLTVQPNRSNAIEIIRWRYSDVFFFPLKPLEIRNHSSPPPQKELEPLVM